MGILNIFKKNKIINQTKKNQEVKKTYELLENEKLIHDNNEAYSFEMELYEKIGDSLCPYCKKEINTIEDGTCPSCNKIIKVADSYIDNEKKLILNEEDYFKLVDLRKKFEFYKKVSSNLAKYGVKKEEIESSLSSPLEASLEIYKNLIAKPSVKKKYDYLSLAYYQVSNIEKFLEKGSYLGSLLLSMYYDYLFDYDINFLMNEANIIKIGGFIEFIPEFLPAKIQSLKESKKSNNELKEIFNKTVTEDRFKDNALDAIIHELTKEEENNEAKEDKKDMDMDKEE